MQYSLSFDYHTPEHGPIYLLPSPGDLLRTKRECQKRLYKEVVKEVSALEERIRILVGMGKEFRAKYESYDRQLAEIDGRYKVEIVESKKTTKKKETTVKYTQEQIANIASALGISLED